MEFTPPDRINNSDQTINSSIPLVNRVHTPSSVDSDITRLESSSAPTDLEIEEAKRPFWPKGWWKLPEYLCTSDSFLDFRFTFLLDTDS